MPETRTMPMSCEMKARLQAEAKSASESYALYAYQENAHLRGISKTQTAQLLREARTRMGETSNAYLQHMGSCEVCRADRGAA
jgi:hypothetical protein